MSPATAIAFACLGVGIILVSSASTRLILTAHALALPPAAMGALSLTGYAYGVENLYNFGPYVSVALNTSICLCTLSAALLLTRADNGWRQPLTDRPAARAVLARPLPWSLVVPFLTGILVLAGVRAGFYKAMYGPSLFAVATTGAFVWLSWTAADVARQAEVSVARSEARFRQVAETLPNMVFITDPEGQVTYTNTTFQRFSGTQPPISSARAGSRSFIPMTRRVSMTKWQRAASMAEPYETEYRLRRHDGAYVVHLGRSQPLRDETGRITAWFGTFTDIQEMADARQLMARTNEELEAQVAQRTGELVQLQKMEAVGQLTGGIAHDFNNLLAGITGSLELMETRMAQGRFGDLERYMAVAARRGQARGSADPSPPRLLTPPDARSQAHQREPAGRGHAGVDPTHDWAAGLLEVVGTAGVWGALIDPGQLENVLLNLCINARDAMPDGGRITIETANKWLDERGALTHDMPPGQYLTSASPTRVRG